MLTGTALASPASGHLIVNGPVQITGPAEISADGATLLLQDFGSSNFEALQLQVQAQSAVVRHIRIQQTCLDFAPVPGLPMNVGDVVPLPSLPGLSRLEPVADAREIVRDAARATSLGGALDTTLGTLAPLDQRIAIPLLEADAPREQQARSESGSTAGSADPLLGLTCVRWAPMEREEIVQLQDARFAIRADDADYTVFWAAAQGEQSDARGRATLISEDVASKVQRHDEEVQFDPEQGRGWLDDHPFLTLPGESILSAARFGSGDIAGDGRIVLFRASAEALGVTKDGTDFQQTYATGESRTSTTQGTQDRVLEFLRIDLKGAEGSYDSPGAVRLLGESQRAEIDGNLRMEGARGTLAVGNETFTLTGQPLVLGGEFAYTLRPLSEKEFAQQPSAPARGEEPSDTPLGKDPMAFAVDGDVQHVESAGVQQDFPASVTTTMAAVSAATVLAGVLAYFWPALKFAGTALYTRIAPDAVLMHGAREQIYRLIKDEPGIHAHEVATRLDLGWGTAVYHLKLLERSGLLISKHEGRYKRFFLTGDPRILRKDAVALLRNGTSRSIASAVAQKPGMIQKQVCQTLGLSPSLASWHLQRLEQAQLVQAQRMGRSVSYVPGPAWAELEPAAAAMPVAAAMPMPASSGGMPALAAPVPMPPAPSPGMPPATTSPA
jgi:predicted transcriptional regulator